MGALLTPTEVCLHVIDVQKSLMAKIYKSDAVAEAVELMVECAKILEIPILANSQYRKGLGPYVDELERLLPESQQIDKVEFSCVANNNTSARIAGLDPKISTVVLVGVETHICVYQTAMDYLDRGFKVWVVADGVSSRHQADHDLALQLLRQNGVTVGPAEMLIYELLGKAGTPQFKQILPFVVARDK